MKICYLAYTIPGYLSYILERNEISGSKILDAMLMGYRVYLEDQNNRFKWESIVALSSVHKEIMDVVVKKT